jgi:AhpD family alkylhydroperoxidase
MVASTTSGWRGRCHVVHLRASQINACAHCIDMHVREARADGETNERLDRLIAWRHVEHFSPAGRAALAWTEALTTLSPNTDYARLRSQLRDHFSEQQIGALTAEELHERLEATRWLNGADHTRWVARQLGSNLRQRPSLGQR